MKRFRILAVDDTPENLLLLQALLGDAYELTTAATGEAALAHAARQPQPDLVLLDVNMPGLSGFDVMRRLRAAPATRGIPVIFLTASAGAQEEQAGFDLGAVDYLTKPFSPPVVLARIRAHLERADNARRLATLTHSLGRYLPAQVCRALVDGSRDVTVHTQRKKMTVFFSDIQDFTASTAAWQPEDITSMLNCYFSEMTAIVDAHGGTLNKFIGDAMMVFFGDPDSQGAREDALRCVRMACAMQRRMHELQAEWIAMGHDRPFRIRCGINTGYCNVGNFGSDMRMDYTLIGAEVNKAARLEQACPAGGILVSRATYACIAGEIPAAPAGALALKGFAEPVDAFAIDVQGAEDAPFPLPHVLPAGPAAGVPLH